MYFSAACLIGLRPVLTKIAPLLGYFSSRVSSSAKERENSSQGITLPSHISSRRSRLSVSGRQWGIKRGGAEQVNEYGEASSLAMLEMDFNHLGRISTGQDFDHGDLRLQTEFEILTEFAGGRSQH